MSASLVSVGAPAANAATVNRAPVAAPDSGAMYSHSKLIVDARANDSDPDGDPLRITAASVQTAGAGSVTVSRQRLVIRSAASFKGQMAITYTISDGRGGQARGSVTIKVVGPQPNHAPVAKPDQATVRAGKTYRIRVLANDSDPDRNRVRLIRVGSAAHGKARRSGSKVVYRARSDYAGADTVTYTIRDSRGATAQGVLRLSVTAKPVKSPSTPSPTRTTRKSVEAALARMGLPVGTVDGWYDARARRAFCAWRTATGRKASRTLPTSSEARAITASSRLPKARSWMVRGINISRKCQAAFWVGKSRKYVRVMAATTGKPGYRTRTGVFRVFRAYKGWKYSTIYPEARMYKPMFFSGGQAMHGSSTDRLVKTYPASHGCVRMLHRDIDAMRAGGVGIGTRVKVFGTW
ncbi:MAG: Ig-like domain-containing protein [Candidatus Nanopelagicales bacterium]